MLPDRLDVPVAAERRAEVRNIHCHLPAAARARKRQRLCGKAIEAQGGMLMLIRKRLRGRSSCAPIGENVRPPCLLVDLRPRSRDGRLLIASSNARTTRTGSGPFRSRLRQRAGRGRSAGVMPSRPTSQHARLRSFIGLHWMPCPCVESSRYGLWSCRQRGGMSRLNLTPMSFDTRLKQWPIP